MHGTTVSNTPVGGQVAHPVTMWRQAPSLARARLAVDKTLLKQGIGGALLKDALVRVSNAADIVGARALLVHAKDEAAL